MKKIIILLLIFVSSISVMAEDILQVTPFQTTSGITENDWDEELTFTVQMNNTNTYTALQFDIFLPEGMTLIDEEPMELLSDRFPGTTKKGVFKPSHKYECTDKGNGHYLITVYHDDFAPIEGNSGDLMVFYYLTSENMKSGVYPIRISGTVLSIDSHNDVKPATSVSYVTIKGKAEETVPVNSLLDLGDNLIPSFVQDQLPANNVIINGVCANLVLTDGNGLTIPSNFTATNATYTREMSNTWGTVCLPYAVNSNTEVAYYSITGVNNGVLMLEKYETLPANTPALVQKISGSSVTCSATNVSVVAGGDLSGSGAVTMHGSYADNTQITASNAYYIKDNKFWLNNGHFFIDAFRAYFTYDAVGGGKPSVLSIDGLPTAIDMLTNSKDVIGVWDANGMMRKHIDKGMNIVKMADGKSVKVFVK